MAAHYKDLIAWQKAMELVGRVYELTDRFPKREVYSLTDQIRRAAVSIPSNIAEGQADFNNGEFLHFLRHASGSLAELETQLLIAERQKYAQPSEVEGLVNSAHELGRILNGLMNSIKNKRRGVGV
jgi:four helix bundle protein